MVRIVMDDGEDDDDNDDDQYENETETEDEDDNDNDDGNDDDDNDDNDVDDAGTISEGPRSRASPPEPRVLPETALLALLGQHLVLRLQAGGAQAEAGQRLLLPGGLPGQRPALQHGGVRPGLELSTRVRHGPSQEVLRLEIDGDGI